MIATVFTHAPSDQPASWRYKKLEHGAITAGVTCPNGHRGDLGDHLIGKRGDVLQVVACTWPGCDFDAHVRLEGWRPVAIVDSAQGKKIALFPSHNRLHDTEQFTAFSGQLIFERIHNTIMEMAVEHRGSPELWVNACLMKFRFMAIPHRDLMMARGPIAKVPPPDEDGLVNLVAFIDANPELFPTFARKELRQAFDKSNLAIPSLLQA